ncbi:MAG: class I SAM-dependent methyltransferase [Candidatus Sifarchaeia archaeon]
MFTYYSTYEKYFENAERHRKEEDIVGKLFFPGLKSLIRNSKNGMFLDVGTGSGVIVRKAAIEGIYSVGIDISRAGIRLGKKMAISEQIDHKIELLIGDATRLPFKDDAFTIVECQELLEHLPNPGSCISELSRVTKREGSVLIQTPNFASPFVVVSEKGVEKGRNNLKTAIIAFISAIVSKNQLKRLIMFLIMYLQLNLLKNHTFSLVLKPRLSKDPAFACGDKDDLVYLSNIIEIEHFIKRLGLSILFSSSYVIRKAHPLAKAIASVIDSLPILNKFGPNCFIQAKKK